MDNFNHSKKSEDMDLNQRYTNGRFWDTLHALHTHTEELVYGFRALNSLYDDVIYSEARQEREEAHDEIRGKLKSLEDRMNSFDSCHGYLFRARGLSKLLKGVEFDDEELLESIHLVVVDWIGFALLVEHVILGQRKRFEDLRLKDVREWRIRPDAARRPKLKKWQRDFTT